MFASDDVIRTCQAGYRTLWGDCRKVRPFFLGSAPRRFDRADRRRSTYGGRWRQVNRFDSFIRTNYTSSNNAVKWFKLYPVEPITTAILTPSHVGSIVRLATFAISKRLCVSCWEGNSSISRFPLSSQQLVPALSAFSLASRSRRGLLLGVRWGSLHLLLGARKKKACTATL